MHYRYVSTFAGNCKSSDDVNKTDGNTADKMPHGTKDLHSGPLASSVTNDVMTRFTKDSHLSRIKQLALIFAGNAKAKLEVAFFVKNLK